MLDLSLRDQRSEREIYRQGLLEHEPSLLHSFVLLMASDSRVIADYSTISHEVSRMVIQMEKVLLDE